MEQHAVPQEISSYQFHLVGDMTLKQFLELAGGVLVGVLIYALPIIGIIKWPLILFSAGAGAALAFIPFEERPLEQWVFAFFRSIYSPTIFNWDNTVKGEMFGAESPEQGAQASMQGQTTKTVFPNKLEEEEVSFLSKVSKLFTPNLTTIEVTPAAQTVQSTVQSVQVTPPSVDKVQTIAPQQAKIEVPTTAPVYVPAAAQPTPAPLTGTGQQVTQIPVQTAQVAQTIIPGQYTPNVTPAQFSQAAAGPSAPEIANTLTGQVLEVSGKIVEGAILEIRDGSGRPVRALKTNKAGHFLSVTPLTNGKYQLIAEKEGLSFDPISFDVVGGIIQPIIYKAKA